MAAIRGSPTQAMDTAPMGSKQEKTWVESLVGNISTGVSRGNRRCNKAHGRSYCGILGYAASKVDENSYSEPLGCSIVIMHLFFLPSHSEV